MSNLRREIITTKDGSSTIHLPEWDEHYHSKHGAIQEAYHVFIRHGLEMFQDREISILEIGFGTGLNAFITFLEGPKLNLNISYDGVEAYPVDEKEVEKLNYIAQLNAHQHSSVFKSFHKLSWNDLHQLTTDFRLKKRKQYFNEICDKDTFDLIYYDAFGARVQPELWTEELFKKMFFALRTGGILVTYSAKGSVRRALIGVGFKVEKLPGPPGKREMLRATKYSA